MNLVDGRIVPAEERDCVMGALEQRILATLAKPRIDIDVVVRACDLLVSTLDESVYLEAVRQAGIPEELGRAYAVEARAMFSAEALRQRLQKELGGNIGQATAASTIVGNVAVTEQILPLGVLLHIAAGNADGIPAFSVLEGLLTGNINLLKLPSVDGGLSVQLLKRLIEIEPSLSDYVYVFDYSSKDITQMSQLIEAADAVVVWGGTEAVAALRVLVPPRIKLIEWGHKLSFAYVTKLGLNDDDLRGIAANIVQTGQLLCSSCQGIFVDTDDDQDVQAFSERFLPVLEHAVSRYSGPIDVGSEAQAALHRRTAELEAVLSVKQVFMGNRCSLVVGGDALLESADGFANVWVKKLPRSQLLRVLRPYRNYLQTVGLACGEEEKSELVDTLLRTGVVRVSSGRRTSATYSGAAHDGEFSLRRYTKVSVVE